ncbi:hypothetical protein AVEN_105755-1 [Araneus ventricosus]|uniref:Uncharacterized protein n=1 Tax=Araneus ventricosus TaxID=182803 RepID=A0A4Y2TYB1_ARAVE|nr:hypothetical protein AVEN_105755-1 [Araneus ventricosus]
MYPPPTASCVSRKSSSGSDPASVKATSNVHHVQFTTENVQRLKCVLWLREKKQETDDEKEENVILIKESEDEDFGTFQQETEVVEMEVLIDFLTNTFALIDTVGSVLMMAHYLYFCMIQEVDGDEYDTTGLRTTNLAK